MAELPVTGYRLLAAANPAELSRLVMKSLTSGWQLWGAPFAAGVLFHQAVYESNPASAYAVNLRLEGCQLLLQRLLEPGIIRQPEVRADIAAAAYTLENELQPARI